MKKFLIIIVTCMSVNFPTLGAESEITVLAVTTGGANASEALKKMQYLRDHWSGFGGTTIRLVNNGTPIPLTTTLYTNSAQQQLNSAIGHPEWLNYRESFAADVVLIFTGQISDQGVCGKAVQYNWTAFTDGIPGAFNPSPPDNLDKRGAENSYYALIATGTAWDCDDYEETAAHELGHLLGAGHTEHSGTQGVYLYSDSHARATTIITNDPFFGTWRTGTKTILAVGKPPVCRDVGVFCIQINQFSSRVNITDNQNTLNTTARSVANYRVTSPGGGSSEPPGCSLSAPTFVVGHVVNSCTEDFLTEHEISWAGGCTSETSNYEVWKSQPVGSGYVYGWGVTGTSTPAFVTGSDGRVKIKACNGVQCSALSLDSYLVTVGC